VTAPRTLLL
nr:Chain P, Peptide VTAPRTLLL [synthetic construct]1KTL_Q Chain Q, Peptide VTAPRTLLL [synthetic construct]